MSRLQLFRSAIFGLFFWFAAAMTVRFAAPFFDGGLANAIILAVSVPVASASLPISELAAGVGRSQVLKVNIIAIIAATLADGIGITFLSEHLYAGVSAASQFGAAWILWGVGWILLFAWRRAETAGREGAS